MDNLPRVLSDVWFHFTSVEAWRKTWRNARFCRCAFSCFCCCCCCCPSQWYHLRWCFNIFHWLNKEIFDVVLFCLYYEIKGGSQADRRVDKRTHKSLRRGITQVVGIARHGTQVSLGDLGRRIELSHPIWNPMSKSDSDSRTMSILDQFSIKIDKLSIKNVKNWFYFDLFSIKNWL